MVHQRGFRRREAGACAGLSEFADDSPDYIRDMQDRIGSISSLLREAASVHHAVYRIADGDDPDWASWYSDWLANMTELPEILGKQPIRSELTYLLVLLGKQYPETSREQDWQDWYAERILSHFSRD